MVVHPLGTVAALIDLVGDFSGGGILIMEGVAGVVDFVGDPAEEVALPR